MRQTVFDYVGNLDTLIAVIVGAVLATLGALFAEIIQDRRTRKRSERDAARFFGDILTSIDAVLDFTFHTHTIGDKWGDVTVRLFKMARKEASVYERNRERLFEIQDMQLRARIHTHFLLEIFPMDAIIEDCDKIEQIQLILKANPSKSSAKAGHLREKLEMLKSDRQSGLDRLIVERSKTDAICKDLEKIAKIKFNFRDVDAAIAQSSSTQEQLDRS